AFHVDADERAVVAARVVPLPRGEWRLQRAEERRGVRALLRQNRGDVERAAEEVDARPGVLPARNEDAFEQRGRGGGMVVAKLEARLDGVGVDRAQRAELLGEGMGDGIADVRERLAELGELAAVHRRP